MADRIARSLTLAVAVALPALLTATVSAQNPTFHQPLNQRTPLGQSAAWLSHIRGHESRWLQPVQISVPGGGEVSVYSGNAEPVAMTASPEDRSR